MPGRASKICSTPECPNVQPCPEHQRKAWAGSTRSSRLPAGWKKRRRYVLMRDPLCRVCTALGVDPPAMSVEVDHIVPGDDHSHENLQGICRDHHREKTLREAAEARGSGR